ncbi:TasA family protein [Pseudonocardia oroxyli]|uniref:SipW-cognate class signal peptide n=1 Tax=Pseudonocardia oroxyli TaxID=366584 RepID=A0A1G7G3K7_PSEOR|nr:TasA family protein [Pseudonocardia oroxyli]SDE82724.1 SipW-cognate class signal peptide [Pseudonocardia oroxyli]
MTIQENAKKDRRRKAGLIIGVVAAVIAAAAIGAGTYAAFTDTETGPGGTQTAGTLDLEIGGTGVQTLFTGTNIAPGYTKDVTFTVHNAGSIGGTLSNSLTLTGADGTCTEPERTAEGGACKPAGDLQDQMTVVVVSSPASNVATAPVAMTEFVKTPLPGNGSALAAGATGTYVLRFALPNDTSTTAETNPNNKVQGDTVTLGSTFTLVQATT